MQYLAVFHGFLGRVLWFGLFPERQTPKRMFNFSATWTLTLKEVFLTSCFRLGLLPCCYFIMPTRQYMKHLKDGCEGTKQTNILHIRAHPACWSTAQLGEGFKNTESNCILFPHSCFPFWGLWENNAHIPSFSCDAKFCNCEKSKN